VQKLTQLYFYHRIKEYIRIYYGWKIPAGQSQCVQASGFFFFGIINNLKEKIKGLKASGRWLSRGQCLFNLLFSLFWSKRVNFKEISISYVSLFFREVGPLSSFENPAAMWMIISISLWALLLTWIWFIIWD